MIRASLKSLLARRVRLLLSTFAIVLGVAFVTGILMFSDTLNRSFTALFASTVGDTVVRPENSDVAGQGAVFSTETVPGLPRSQPSSSCPTLPGSTAWSVRPASTSSRPRTRSSAAPVRRRSAATGAMHLPVTDWRG